MKSRKPALSFIFITLFLDVLGLGLIIPILPKLIESFSDYNVSAAATTVGILAGLYALMQFIFAPILGSLSDRYGRRPIILISLFGSACDYLLLAFAPSLPWFFVGRIINGISGANITAATAYIADISPPEKRAANFGISGAAFGLGFIAGPALGGVLGDYDLRLPFLSASALTLANWLYGFFVLPESLAAENRRAFSWSRAHPVGSLTALRQYPLVLRLAVAIFLINIAQMMLQSTWALYTGYRYDWSPKSVGLSLAFVGLMAALVQGGLARKLIPKLGERRSMITGLSCSTLAQIGYGFAPRGWMLYPSLTVGCLGGIAQPAGQSLISRSIAANEQGAVQGAITSLTSVAGIIGPLIATNLFGWFIGPNAPFPLPGVSFFLAALLMISALWLVRRAFRMNAG